MPVLSERFSSAAAYFTLFIDARVCPDKSFTSSAALHASGAYRGGTFFSAVTDRSESLIDRPAGVLEDQNFGDAAEGLKPKIQSPCCVTGPVLEHLPGQRVADTVEHTSLVI